MHVREKPCCETTVPQATASESMAPPTLQVFASSLQSSQDLLRASISYHTALMAAQRLGHLTFSSVLPRKTQAEKFRCLVLPSELLLVIVIGDHRAKPCTSGKLVTCAPALSQEPVTRCHLTSEDLSLVLCSQSSSVAAQTDVMAENSMQDWRGGGCSTSMRT